MWRLLLDSFKTSSAREVEFGEETGHPATLQPSIDTRSSCVTKADPGGQVARGRQSSLTVLLGFSWPLG